MENVQKQHFLKLSSINYAEESWEHKKKTKYICQSLAPIPKLEPIQPEQKQMKEHDQAME